MQKIVALKNWIKKYLKGDTNFLGAQKKRFSVGLQSRACQPRKLGTKNRATKTS